MWFPSCLGHLCKAQLSNQHLHVCESDLLVHIMRYNVIFYYLKSFYFQYRGKTELINGTISGGLVGGIIGVRGKYGGEMSPLNF